METKNKKISGWAKVFEKECRVCRKTKPIKEFYKFNGEFYRQYCLECYQLPEFNQQRIKDESWKEKRRQKERELDRLNPEKKMWESAKQRAKKFNLPFNLDVEDIIIPEFCPILGIKIQQGEGKTLDNSPSLDKIVPDKGYIKGNVRVVSWKANSIKKNGTIEDFKKIIKYLKENT